jgi:pimeloyl-ACP methyl ester carboxylesterase
VARLALSLRRSYASRAEAVERYRVTPPSDRIGAELLQAIAKHSVRREEDGRWGFKFDPRWFGVPARPAPDLGRVRARVLIVRGAESSLLSPEGAETLVGELPGARLLTIGEAGHHVHLDQPERTLSGLLEFLEPESRETALG